MEQKHTAEFVEENLKTIFAYALSRVSDRDDAEDLTSDIVLAILQSADKIRNPDAFYGYVWGIAANTYRKFLRKRKRFSYEEIDESASDESDFTHELFEREDAIRLRREIALLSREYRECTVAYYYDELSCAEVSNKLHISLDMVKYYLFKTRKILKEGICMEREFGEKSFRPAPFEFNIIFSGTFNREYQNLFTRKLPGQILLSAYYMPMTTRELAIELGVASVYLEDEIAMLEKYNLIGKTPAGKYQTNLVIFTDDFTNEYYSKAEKFTMSALAEIILGIKGKLAEIRSVNTICKKLSDSRLLWGLLWLVIRQGNQEREKARPELQKKDTLFGKETGTKYGVSREEFREEYECPAFAGYAGIDENYYASAADFGVLPMKNRYFQNEEGTNIVGTEPSLREKIYQTVSGQMEPEFMILTEAEEEKLFEILSTEIERITNLYQQLFTCASGLMHVHAPKSVSEQIDRIVFQTSFFRTVGFIGGCAVKSGALSLPDFDGAAAMYIRKTAK